MDTRSNYVRGWLDAVAPHSVHFDDAAETEGTFQATGTIGKLHILASGSDLIIKGGTGDDVDATGGLVWLASFGPYYFRPKEGSESMGYAAYDGSTTFDTTAKAVSVACIEP